MRTPSFTVHKRRSNYISPRRRSSIERPVTSVQFSQGNTHATYGSRCEIGEVRIRRDISVIWELGLREGLGNLVLVTQPLVFRLMLAMTSLHNALDRTPLGGMFLVRSIGHYLLLVPILSTQCLPPQPNPPHKTRQRQPAALSPLR